MNDSQEGLDIQVVRSEDDLEEHLLVDLHELLVPLVNVGRLLARVRVVVLGSGGVVAVVLAPLKHFAEDRLGDLRSLLDTVSNSYDGDMARLTFMIGIGSSPGAPRSSIIFLMSMERSAVLRSVVEVSMRRARSVGISQRGTHE